MSQGRRLTQEIERIRELRASKRTIDEIWGDMDYEISRASVGKYVREFDKLSESERARYKVLDWDHLEEHGFSPEVSRFLLRCWVHLGRNNPLTVVEAQWLARIYELAPNVDPTDARLKANLFMYRERLQTPERVIDNSDLWAWVAFQQEDSWKYEDAIERGHFPPVRPTPPNLRKERKS